MAGRVKGRAHVGHQADAAPGRQSARSERVVNQEAVRETRGNPTASFNHCTVFSGRDSYLISVSREAVHIQPQV